MRANHARCHLLPIFIRSSVCGLDRGSTRDLPTLRSPPGLEFFLSASYEDRAVSGASDKRPAYQQMLADAEAGQFDVVVSEALDRLGRRLSDVARLYDHLEFSGIHLHAVNIGKDHDACRTTRHDGPALFV